MKNFIKKLFSEPVEEKIKPDDLYSKYNIEPYSLSVYRIKLSNPRVLGRHIFIRTYPFDKDESIDVYISKNGFELDQKNFVMMLENYEQLRDLYKGLEGKNLENI